jgi:hypothetical protein
MNLRVRDRRTENRKKGWAERPDGRVRTGEDEEYNWSTSKAHGPSGCQIRSQSTLPYAGALAWIFWGCKRVEESQIGFATLVSKFQGH